MIRKGGNRFSEEIMLKQGENARDSTELNRTLAEEARMKKLINDVETAMSESLAGFCAAHSDIVRIGELAPFGDRPVNATEAVTAICAIMRAADLNFFDLQMWYRRAHNE